MDFSELPQSVRRSAGTSTKPAPLVTVRPGSVNSGIESDRIVRIYQRTSFGRTTYELWCGRSDSGKRASTLEAAQAKAIEYQARIDPLIMDSSQQKGSDVMSATKQAVDVWTLQLGDAVALAPTATLPLYVRAIQRRRNRVEVTYPDGTTGWVAARKLIPFTR